MCLFLEMLQVKKCRNLNVCVWGGGKYFPITVKILPCRKSGIPFFLFCCITDKIIRGNIIYDLFNLLVEI